MKKIYYLILVLFTFTQLNSQPVNNNKNINDVPRITMLHPSNDANWTLIFNDNFNTLNRAVWNVGNNFSYTASDSWWFRDNPNNVFISNGILSLRAINQRFMGRPFTGAYISTNELFGRNTFIEANIRIQPVPGNFPAFWLWRGNGGCGTNDYNEIDIMEYFGCWVDAYHSSVHYCVNGSRASGPIWNHLNGRWVNTGNSSSLGGFLTNTNIGNGGFHTFSGFWQRDFITYQYDNIIHRIHSNNNTIQFPMPIVLSQAVSTAVCSTYVKPPPNNFPMTMEVDWVRVYQLNCDRNTIVTQIPNFNTFNWAVKRSYSLTNTTTVPNNANVSLMARDFIDLNNNFSIPNNTNFSITIIDCQ